MKRKLLKLVTVGATAAALTAMPVFADEEAGMEEIGNITYTVPDGLEARHSEGNGVEQNMYKSGNSIIIAQYERGSEAGTPDQQARVGEIAESFASLNGYNEDENVNLSFQSLPANMKSFSYEAGGTKYDGKSYVVYTGDGIASFMFGCPSDAEDLEEQTEIFSKLTGSVKTKRLTDGMEEGAEGGETEEETEAPVQKEFSEGSYKCGEQMPAGEYTLTASENGGHVTISEDSGKEAVKMTRDFDKNMIISPSEGDYVEFSGAQAVLAEPGQEADLSGEGMFEAGVHIQAGTYDLVADEGADGYFRAYVNAKQKAIRSEGPVSGESQVTLEDGNCLELFGCHFKETPAIPEKVFTDKSIVKKAQTALNEAGFDCGKPDGIAGSKTAEAIKKYCVEKNIPETSKLTAEVLDSLGISAVTN